MPAVPTRVLLLPGYYGASYHSFGLAGPFLGEYSHNHSGYINNFRRWRLRMPQEKNSQIMLLDF